MIKYLFCHGFGFSANYWKNFSHLLIKGEANFIDLGYFGKCNIENILPNYNNNNSLKIGIGHSLGFMKLIDFKINFDLLIGINAFSDFLGIDNLHEHRKGELTLLDKHFNINPILTLKNFYRRCGLKEPLNNLALINHDALSSDLKSLAGNVVTPQDIPILIINTKDDIIVPKELTLTNFKHQNNIDLKMLDKGKHSIIINDANKTANLINDFVKNYV